MAFPKSVLPLAPVYIQSGSYAAQDDRRVSGDVMSPGIVSAGDFAVTLTTLLGISVAPGTGYVPGLNVADQGAYRQRMVSAAALTDDPANATLPRLDQVILRVMDSTADTSGLQEGRIEIATGTATAGATLDNRTGAADLTALAENSKNVLLLADLLTPAAATTFTGANLRDRRVPAIVGLGRGGAFRQNFVVNQVTANATVQTLFSLNLDKALIVDQRWIHIVANWLMENSSGAAVTSTYTISATPGSTFWQDPSASIPSAASPNFRPCQVEIWIPIKASGAGGGTGRLVIGSQPAAAGAGDAATAPVVDSVFQVGVINPTNTISLQNILFQTAHSSASGSFTEYQGQGYVEVF
jgi:hypothetical protein